MILIFRRDKGVIPLERSNTRSSDSKSAVFRKPCANPVPLAIELSSSHTLSIRTIFDSLAESQKQLGLLLGCSQRLLPSLWSIKNAICITKNSNSSRAPIPNRRLAMSSYRDTIYDWIRKDALRSKGIVFVHSFHT